MFLKRVIYKLIVLFVIMPYRKWLLKQSLKKFIGNDFKKNIFLIGTPVHGNLGDQAITMAELQFLQEKFADCGVFEIPYPFVTYGVKLLKKKIRVQDIIVLTGGGNMGDEYLWEEEVRRYIIQSFPHQKIISFPQTIYFSDTENGRNELRKTQMIYNAHPHFTIIAREKTSFQIMKDSFCNQVLLVPDIVMSLNYSEPSLKRDGILFCFRQDCEKVIDNALKDSLYEYLCENYVIRYIDTIVKNEVTAPKRKKELEKIWTDFKSAELVITDRLHGMIFAAITGTPCIALPNYNYKVQGTYDEWLKHLPYIRFIETQEGLYKVIDELLQMEACQYDDAPFQPYYEKLAQLLAYEEGVK